MGDPSDHNFVNKAITVNVWGMDAALKPFTGAVKTRQLAERAVEIDFTRQLAMDEVIGLSYQGKKSRFRVIQSFISGPNTYRITLEDTGTQGTACMWAKEMESPDVIVPRGERRKETRLTVVGSATLFNEEGSSSQAKITDISRNGCYIETFAPSPVGAQMRTLLNLEDVKDLEVTTVVRTCHPSIGMGMEIIAFGSDDERVRLHDLVGALEAQQG